MPCTACNDERYVLALGPEPGKPYTFLVPVAASRGLPIAREYRRRNLSGRIDLIRGAGLTYMDITMHIARLERLMQVEPSAEPCPFCQGPR